MWIEIKTDVVQKAIDEKANPINDAADFLRDLSIAIKRQKHVIYVPCLADLNLKAKLAEVIGQQYTSLLALGLDHRMDIGRVKSLVLVSCVISYERTLQIPANTILINPEDCGRFECFQETHVITENLADSDFYKFLIQFYCRSENITLCTHRYYPLMGGGATSAKVLESEIELKQHFTVAIADSDKHYSGADYGETYKKMQSVIDTKHPKFCALEKMERVAEIENLIPHKFLKLHNQYTEEHEKIFNRDPEHYDIKKGFSVRSLFKDDMADHWRTRFPDIDFSKRDNLKAANPTKVEYDAAAKDLQDGNLINISWGSNVLSELLEVVDFSDVTSEDLTADQRYEWIKIGRFLFSWTCCLSQSRVL